MKIMEQEFFAVSYAVSLGMRKDMWRPSGQRWEVYLRLSSGSQIILATEGSRKEAKEYLKQMAGNIGQVTGCAFMVADAGNNLIIMDAITRVYVDKQENWHVVLVEDIASGTHQVERGDKDKCDSTMMKIAGAIIQYQHSKGGISIEPGGEDTGQD